MENKGEDAQYATFKTILSYCLFILAAPVVSFFAMKFLFFEGVFGIDTTSSNVWSAVVAVIVLHAALGLYIRKAYFAADQTPVKPVKID